MELIGYVRVSDKDQNIDRQMIKMKTLSINERFIFVDKATGKDFNRPQYQTMKNIIREGDLVYIDSLDRLGRNYDEIINEWKQITRMINADIVVLDNETLFDSRKFKSMGDLGKLMEDQFLSLLAYVAEQERFKILQRQREGIEVAKLKGVHLGRPKINFSTLSVQQKETLKLNYQKWITKEIKGVKFAELLGVKKNTFYKILKEYQTFRNADL